MNSGSTNINLQMRKTDGTSAVINETFSVSGIITRNTWHHIAMTLDSTIANGGKLYIDGTLRFTSTNDAFSAAKLGTNFSLGSYLSSPYSMAFAEFDELATDKIIGLGSILSDDEILNIYNKPGGLPRTLI